MTEERAHYWTHPALPAVDLLDARYVRHTFGKHTHDTYVIAAITSGVEAFRYRGAVEVAPAGSLALVDPDTLHTGHAGVPEGWSYQVLYPSVASLASVAEELGGGSGTPGFRTAVVVDEELTRLVHQVHAAAEQNQPLAASTLLRLALARTVGAHTTARRPGPRPPAAGRRAAELARELLAARITDPPTLEELAAATGARPFPLLRAFRSAYGLPPHAWLTQHRVSTARRLLDTGTAPADAAVSVGFVDQAHLTRHFRRIIGVPPGAYRRANTAARRPPPERRNVQESTR
ncbi:AraC family transcriptional regulator [Streptacidiphilus sp. P02-A3a]|uniref:AraC family transcriptional regulator n=1 Tax=Streptacidiphilus sp. P02-A3a TaxID=2704468 RepID=UPI0015F81B94|nr:AraC family transcriptional regulator [Streptacidiphilus sp. P02-A3a]QMU72250.1 AraC family transcriptional regulator [Streptacidiphilus sp. P02-A3a]